MDGRFTLRAGMSCEGRCDQLIWAWHEPRADEHAMAVCEGRGRCMRSRARVREACQAGRPLTVPRTTHRPLIRGPARGCLALRSGCGRFCQRCWRPPAPALRVPERAEWTPSGAPCRPRLKLLAQTRRRPIGSSLPPARPRGAARAHARHAFAESMVGVSTRPSRCAQVFLRELLAPLSSARPCL